MKTIHCLFEQSGTFKNVFKEFGHEALDYDMLNEHGQTDVQIDLFKEIENEYDNIVNGSMIHKTIFTNMSKDNDFIMAFFPCTHFADANQLQYRLLIGGKKRELTIEATERLIARNKQRAYFFELYLKFVKIVKHKGIPTIIENPASSGDKNYLVMFSPVDVGYYEKDRSIFGDRFKKPTNFFTVNFEMKEKLMMFEDKVYETINIYDIQSKAVSTGGRSKIENNYANNFYKRFLEGKV